MRNLTFYLAAPSLRRRKIKFSSTFFKRWRVSSGQRLLVARRSGRKPLRWKRLLKGKATRQNCLVACGTFCKRKSSQPTTASHNPDRLPGGRPVCYRTRNPVSGKQRSAFSSGRLSLHPIRVLVEWVAQLFTSRHRVSAVKVFVHPLQKVAGSTYPCLQKK